MKKIAFLFLSVLLLCAMLVGCGKKDGADYVFGALEKTEERITEAVTAPFAASGDTHVAFSVADVGGLCELLGYDLGKLELGAASVGGTFNDDGTKGTVDIAVELGRKNLTLHTFLSEAAVVLTSDQLSDAYGITLEGLGELAGSVAGEQATAVIDGIAVPETAKTAKKVEARYSDFFEALARENLTFEVENAEKNVIVTCALTPENIAAVGSALLTEVQEDEEMQALLEKLGGVDLVGQILSMVVSKEDILAQLSELDFGGAVSFTVVKKTTELIGLSAELEIGGTPFALGYTADENRVACNMQIDANTVDMRGEVTEDTVSFSVTAAEDGEEVFAFLFDVSDDIELSCNMNGELFAVYADYTNTKTAFTMTMREIKVGMFGMDLAPYGIALAVDTDAKVEDAPKEYVSMEEFGFADLQKLLTEFVMNAGLLALLK